MSKTAIWSVAHSAEIPVPVFKVKTLDPAPEFTESIYNNLTSAGDFDMDPYFDPAVLILAVF